MLVVVVIYRLLCVVSPCSLLVVRCSLFVVRCSLRVVACRCLWRVDFWCSLFAMRRCMLCFPFFLRGGVLFVACCSSCDVCGLFLFVVYVLFVCGCSLFLSFVDCS